MSGYNTRKIYDNCYNIEFIDQQVNPAKYRMFDDFAENNSKCYSLNGPRANKNRSTGELGTSTKVHRTDIESQLFNLDVPDARCITLKTMKEKNERLKKIIDLETPKYTECDNKQNFNYSRLNIPVNNFRSVEINRFEFPLINPSEFVYYGAQNTEQMNNERFGINTQLRAKDKISKPNMTPTSSLIY